MKPQVSVQIVNFNTKQYLSTCLKSIKKNLTNSGINFEINILDNNSQDNLTEIKKKYQSDTIHFYGSDKNRGFGSGQNILAKKSHAPYLLIINPDIKLIEPNTISRLLQSLTQNSQNKVVGPQLLTTKKAIQPWDHGELTNKKAQQALSKGFSFWQIRKRICEAAWVSGAIFLVEKDIFNQIGGFDENFFMYKEEEDLCLRIRQLGGKIIYDPTIKVIHSGTKNTKDQYLKSSIDYFLRKHITKN